MWKLGIAVLATVLWLAPQSRAQSGVGGGGQSNVGGGGTTGTSNYPSLTNTPQIDPRTYGAKFNAGTNNAATTTSTSATITCTGCKFVTGTIGTSTPPAAVGQYFFATDSTSSPTGVNTCLSNATVSFGGNVVTTIASIQSDTQLTVNGTSNTTSTGNACIAWGTDDTTALNNAWAAGGCITTLLMPGGMSIFSAPIFQKTAGCPSISGSGTGYQGQRLWGSSVVGTYLLPIPSGTGGFNWTNCAGALATNGCVGNINVGDYEDFNVWGLGARCSANENHTALVLIGSATRAVNVNGVGWCSRGGGNTQNDGFLVSGATDIFTWGGGNYFGSTSIEFGNVAIDFGNSFFTGELFSVNSTPIVELDGGASVYSHGNGVTGAIQIGTGGTQAVFTSVSLYHTCQDSSGAGINVATSSKAFFLANDYLCQNPPTGALALYLPGTGSFVSMKGSNVAGGASTGYAIDCVGGATNIISDEGGNTFTAGGAGTITGCQVANSNSASGTITLTSTQVGLTSGWGTSSFGSGTGDAHKGHFTVTGAAGSASPTLTLTYPHAYPLVAPASCLLFETAADITGGLSSVVSGTPGLSSVVFTFTGTPTAVTYTFDYECGP
jgi:hypothetical protein